MNVRGKLDRRSSLLICLSLAMAILIVYWQVQDHAFLAWDDQDYVVENPNVRTGFTVQNILWAFSSPHASNWHPLTWLSHMLDVEVYGLHPGGHHWTSVILHVANTLLLFLFMQASTGAKWSSAFVAALFALHPLRMESVAWVAERKDVLSAFFWMSTLLAYLRYTRSQRVGSYLLVSLLFALGLLSKPMVVTLPFVLLLLDFWPLRRCRGFSPSWRLLREKVPLFILSGVSSLLTFSVQKSSGAVFPSLLSIKDRVANALVSYVHYIFKMVWPLDLSFFYPHPMDAIPPWLTAICLLFLGLVTIGAFRFGGRSPYLLVGWLWYLGTLVPVIGLIQVGSQAIAARFTYIPQIGLSLILVWGVREIFERSQVGRTLLPILGPLAVLLLSVSTFHQLQFWKNGVSLFSHAIRIDRQNSRAHYLLGNELFGEGKIAEAAAHYTEAVRILPQEPAFLNGLAMAYLRQGRTREAIHCLREALRLSPRSAETLTNLGSALARQGEPEEAIRSLTLALESRPLAEAHHNLGLVLAAQGRLTEAVSHYEEALRIRPVNSRVHNDLGVAWREMGEQGKAMMHFTMALRQDPRNPAALRNLQILRARPEERSRGSEPPGSRE
jgi:protein O-mannosyl-transferase